MRLVAAPSAPADGPARELAEQARTPEPPPGARHGRGEIGRRGLELLEGLEDEQLVPLAASSSSGLEARRAACEALYRRHASFAFNLAVRIAGSAQDAEDTVHDAFLKAFHHLERLRDAKAFRGWLGSIVVHAVRSKLRRQRLLRTLGLVRGEVIDIDCIASRQADPGTRAELAQVYALLGTMSTDDRIAWTLRHVDGHDLQTAAELTACSLATVKRRIRRAQEYLDAHFVGAQACDDEPNFEEAPAVEEDPA